MATPEYSQKFISGEASTENVHGCKISTSFFLLTNHVRRYHSPLPFFNCETSNIEVFRCKHCNFQTELTLFFKHHIETHRAERENKDLLSDQYTTRKYSCGKCSFETHFALKWLLHTACLGTKECNLKKHKIVKHLIEDEVTWYRCINCCYKSKSEAHLNMHLSFQHLDKQNNTLYSCDKCPYRSKCKADVKKHTNIYHLDEQGSNCKWYRCPNCPYKAKHNSHLKKHIKAYHASKGKKRKGKAFLKWFDCKLCSFKSKYESVVYKHIDVHHLDKKDEYPKCVQWHECKQCPYKTTQMAGLAKHMKACVWMNGTINGMNRNTLNTLFN